MLARSDFLAGKDNLSNRLRRVKYVCFFRVNQGTSIVFSYASKQSANAKVSLKFCSLLFSIAPSSLIKIAFFSFVTNQLKRYRVVVYYRVGRNRDGKLEN